MTLNEPTPYKICFVAYCCEPGRGSEWGLGWSYVQEMSRTQPVWVVVHDDCRQALDRYLRETHADHPVHPIYVKLPQAIEWMRNSSYSLFNVYYYLWQFAAARAMRRVHRDVKLDVVQHVSLCRWWMPSAAATLASRGVAFVFGPVGGGEILPKQFRNRSPIYGKLSDTLRFVSRALCRRDPLLVRTLRRADLLIAAIPAVQTWFGRYRNERIELGVGSICSDSEVLRGAVEARAARPKDGPFTFGSCGGLSYYRGVDLAIRAFAQAAIPNSRYVHACDGPMRPALEQLAKELGVADRVVFLGDVSHADNVKTMSQCDAVVHTVLRDSQGVLPDALYAGVPVITLDHLTPAMLVTPECGHLIPIDDTTTPQRIVDELAVVMKQWHADPALLAAKGEAARERGRAFLPEARGIVIRSAHERAMRHARQRTANAVRPMVPPQSSIGTASSG